MPRTPAAPRRPTTTHGATSRPRHAADEQPALDSLGATQAMVVAASAPIVYQGARAGAIVGGLRVDRATLAALRQASGIELSLVDAAGATRAATADAAAASQSRAYRCRATDDRHHRCAHRRLRVDGGIRSGERRAAQPRP
jgi:hypothetical protein